MTDNIENWLKPIESGDEFGAGCDIRMNSDKQARYYDLKDYRRQLHHHQESLLLGEAEDLAGLSWHEMAMQADVILCDDSKDIEVACWLVEALAYRDGLVGIQQGLSFLSKLIEQYAGHLYPNEEEDDEPLLSLASLSGQNNPGTLVSALNLAALIDVHGTPISLWTIYQADETSTPTEAEISQLFMALSEEKADELAKKITAIQNQFTQLDDVIEKHYTDKAPSLAQMRDAITKAARTIQLLLKKAEVEQNESEDKHVDNQKVSSSSALQGRADALHAIQAALQYYQQNEPHSPINNLLQRVLDWSNLSLLEILSDIVPSEGQLDDFARVLGFSQTNKD